MKKISNILRKIGINPHRYERLGNAYIVESKNGKFVVKKNNSPIYEYLNQRSFDYYPSTTIEEGYEIVEYEEGIELSDSQKSLELISLVALLHAKTTYYKSITEYDYKDIYEDVKGNIKYLDTYYNELMDKIETEVYMCPSSYLLARHITHVFNALSYCKQSVEAWYEKVKNKNKIRLVILHNNLSLDHFINNKLISWNKAKTGSPILDLYKLYRRTYSTLVWDEVMGRYMSSYPLQEDELDLFYLLISIPNNLEFSNSEYKNVKLVNRYLEYMNITGNFIETMKKTSY